MNKRGGVHTAHSVVATSDGIRFVPAKRRHLSAVQALQNPDDLIHDQVSGFTNFLREYAVVGLAVGFVLGQQANTTVNQLVGSFINPFIQVLIGTNLKYETATFHHGAQPVQFAWGAFVYALIEFIFVAIIIYVVVKLLRLDKLKKSRR
ncbi:MAG TPA: MscL family protein [Candidatus Saccharimonadales bacterium]|nr:MscL family protein [Candidatus Saccharimonadales bacterium]